MEEGTLEVKFIREDLRDKHGVPLWEGEGQALAKRLCGWVVGQAVGAPLGEDICSQMLVPSGIACGRGRLGSRVNHRPRERPFPFPLLLSLQQ